jgi:hypothetical protein
MRKSCAISNSPRRADTTERSDRPELETLEEAEAWNLKRIDELADREPEIAVALEACCRDARCGSLMCAVCARRFRFGVIRELLRIARGYRGLHEVAVIHLETLPVGTLAKADINRAHDRLRKRLHRLGFAGSILIGGTEVAWLARDDVWILHVHLLAIGVPREAWEALEGQLAGSGRFDPLRVDELQNPERQLSYALKFATYHRPGKIGRNGRAQAYPLPPDRLAELATWWSRYRFKDFVFLFGARRRGDRIVPDV